MSKFKIKKVKAKNFLCYGEDGIEIDFENMGNIILIRGKNEDIPSDNEEEQIASNGVGKSSIGEMIIYGLTGETIRKLKVNQVINNQNGKRLHVEIWVDDLRIVRRREPTSFHVFQIVDGKEVQLSLGEKDETQNWINNRLGITIGGVQSLINLIVSTDNNAGCFLESDKASKRQMCESYFGLDIYGNYFKNAKALNNAFKAGIKELSKEYENCEKEEEAAQRRIARVQEQEVNWKNTKQIELNDLVAQIKAKQKEMASTDNGAAIAFYEKAQIEIEQLNVALPEQENELNQAKSELDKLTSELDALRTDKNGYAIQLPPLKLAIGESKSIIVRNNNFIADAEAAKCKKCGNYDAEAATVAKAAVAREEKNIEQFTLNYNDIEVKVNDLNDKIITLSDKVKVVGNKHAELTKSVDIIRRQLASLNKIEKPTVSSQEKLLEDQLNELKIKTLAKKDEVDGPSPYVENIKNAIEEKQEKVKIRLAKRNELNDAGKLAPYYEFWAKAFAEDGIRKFILNDIIPALNSRIAYWMNYLIDNKISLSFDSSLEEKIERNPSDGDHFVYSAMSGGERRRLNLAVSQSFSHIMSVTTGTCPSIIFLDEVTTNIDPIGVQGVYNMIIELAKERQVLITTHDQGLLEMLEGYESINLVKNQGFTKIAN